MNGHVERQAQALFRFRGRPPDGKPRDRKHMLREAKQRRDGSRVISYRADRACTQPDGFRGQNERGERNRGIDGGIEKRIQMIVRKRPATP